MQAQVGAEQAGEHLHHRRAADDGIEGRMHLVGRLDAADLGLGGGVPGLEVVDRGVGVDRGSARHQFGDDLTQCGQLRCPEKVGHHNEPVALIGVSLGIADHIVPVLDALVALAHR